MESFEESVEESVEVVEEVEAFRFVRKVFVEDDNDEEEEDVKAWLEWKVSRMERRGRMEFIVFIFADLLIMLK